MKTRIRKTTKADFLITENITREAFWNVYKPGCDEHLVLHNVRNGNSYIAELDMVAVVENEIIGHIISTKAKVVDVQNTEHEVLCVGPVSVLPDYQKQGMGSELINESIKVAKESGYPAMILFGNPDYYHRFGFRNAQEYGITTKYYENFEPFMALELQTNGLENITGRFFEDNAFTTEPNELIEFEKQFPYKEKMVTDTQLEH
ncbi:MAG TPA: N-acetyltransferase [Paludibacter sp.]